jgi:hypothetical protein
MRESCCFMEAEDATAVACAVATSSSPAAASSRWACRACGADEASVLLLPCQHLCLCKSCEPRADAAGQGAAVGAGGRATVAHVTAVARSPRRCFKPCWRRLQPRRIAPRTRMVGSRHGVLVSLRREQEGGDGWSGGGGTRVRVWGGTGVPQVWGVEGVVYGIMLRVILDLTSLY